MALLFKYATTRKDKLDNDVQEEVYEAVSTGQEATYFHYSRVLESHMDLNRVYDFVTLFEPMALSPQEFLKVKGGKGPYFASKGVLSKGFKGYPEEHKHLIQEEYRSLADTRESVLRECMNGITSFGEVYSRVSSDPLQGSFSGPRTNMYPLSSMTEITRGPKKGLMYVTAEPVPIHVVKEYVECVAPELLEQFHYLAPTSTNYGLKFSNRENSSIPVEEVFTAVDVERSATCVIPLSKVPSQLDVLPSNFLDYILTTEVGGLCLVEWANLLSGILDKVESGVEFTKHRGRNYGTVYFKDISIPVFEADVEEFRGKVRALLENKVVEVTEELFQNLHEHSAILMAPFSWKTVPIGRAGWRITFKDVDVLAENVKGKRYGTGLSAGSVSIIPVSISAEITHECVPGVRTVLTCSFEVSSESLVCLYTYYSNGEKKTTSKLEVYRALTKGGVESVRNPFRMSLLDSDYLLKKEDAPYEKWGQSQLVRFLLTRGGVIKKIFDRKSYYTPPASA